MQLTATALPDRITTQRRLNDLAIDLSSHDAQLTAMVNNGNTVGRGWDTWFNQAANDLLNGRDAYMQLRPQDSQLAARLGQELINIGQNGGRIASAYADGATLASGWRNALDDAISVVRQAAHNLSA